MATTINSRYRYINNPQYSVLGTNSEQQLGPENIDWSGIIQSIYQNYNIVPQTSGVDNTYRLQYLNDNQIKPAYTTDNKPTIVDKIHDNLTPEKIDSYINTGKEIFNTAKSLFNTADTASKIYGATTELGNFSEGLNSAIDSAAAKETVSTASNTSNFNWGQAANIGAGIAATVAKKAYNAYAPDLYTKDVDDNFEELAYNDIYGKTNEDPLQRASAILSSNEDRMQHSTNALNSQVLDYSKVHNNDNLMNVYNNTLDNLKPVEYEEYGSDNYKFLAPLVAGFGPGLLSTALATMPAWGTTSKRAQDFNQSTMQGALAGTSYGGLGWGTLGGATLGSIASILTGIGAKKRTQMYNEALEKAKKANVENFYNTAERNLKNEIFDMQRNSLYADGGSLADLNGVTEFNVGGSHEQNPYDGIQQGIASDGSPNLVEEGEVKYKDYIYSARLKPSKSLLKEFNLPDKYNGKTFAELADILQKESEERPNDPISLQTLDDWMSRLASAQEEYKAKAEERRLAKVVDNMSDEEKAALLSSLEQPMVQQEGIDLSQPMYAKGGKIHIKPSKRGTFTAAAKKHGKSVQAFASQVLANKENYSPAMVKKANFARNAAKWHKHEDGGHLFPWGGKPWEVGYIYDNDIAQPTTIDGTVVDFWGNTPYPLRVQNPVVVEDNNSAKSIDWSNLRYAPAVGAGLGALTALLQPKDYYLADALRDISKQYKPMGAPHIGGKRKAKTYDVNLGNAENLAMQTAVLRANRSNANRGQQTAGAIGIINAFEKQNALRNLEWQRANEAAELENAKYNLAIDQFNTQQDAAADRLNAEINNRRIAALMSAAQAEDTANSLWKQNVSGTTENFFNQLGNVGRDTWNRNQRDFLLGALGREGLLELIKSGYFNS